MLPHLEVNVVVRGDRRVATVVVEVDSSPVQAFVKGVYGHLLVTCNVCGSCLLSLNDFHTHTHNTHTHTRARAIHAKKECNPSVKRSKRNTAKKGILTNVNVHLGVTVGTRLSCAMKGAVQCMVSRCGHFR